MELSSDTLLPQMSSSTSHCSIRGLLQQLLRITVTDGRIFIGSFAGTDQPLNILLINAEEFRIGPNENANGRYVGQVVVPWKLVVKVEAQGKGVRDTGNGHIADQARELYS